jgi:hypothetical protein
VVAVPAGSAHRLTGWPARPPPLCWSVSRPLRVVWPP